MLGELIGEFKGRNTVYRVLDNGKVETSGQGMGKILGIDAYVVSTSVGTMQNGLFVGRVNSVITIASGESVILQGNAVGYPSGEGGATRAASIQATTSEKLMRLNRIVALHEYQTDMADNWVGKIWEWK
ncbi:MAG: hypothetical protein NWE93_13705 [Candidatus Bathyarchaeota archaeon]|nr:hypothetical protein [Candidatus Bathyarchaeota archaeon]